MDKRNREPLGPTRSTLIHLVVLQSSRTFSASSTSPSTSPEITIDAWQTATPASRRSASLLGEALLTIPLLLALYIDA